jgi:hypothetical protein
MRLHQLSIMPGSARPPYERPRMDRIAMRPIATGPGAPSWERSYSVYTTLVVTLAVWLVIAVLYLLARTA